MFSGFLSRVYSYTFDFSYVESKALTRALEDILERFYSKHTSTLFVRMHSSLSVRDNPDPNEIVNEMIRNQNQISMCYVIESQSTIHDEMSNRFFNIFVVDSYESFR